MEAMEKDDVKEVGPERPALKDTPNVVDLEKTADGASLQREVSGPPYSIFNPRMKVWIIFLVSISALISPFAATTYYPVLNVLGDVLHITPTMTNISICTYMVSFCSKRCADGTK
jgi:hypothetical protein